VELGRTHMWLPYFQMALGMAEYRSGHFATAEMRLSAAEQTAQNMPNVRDTARFYRAMSLFQQGKPVEARQLFAETEVKMIPLPADEKNPLAGGKDADYLILWLACKEAKALLNEPRAGEP
jgi:hypothetical protein